MSDRVDASGAAYAGSQLQTQLYVNKRTEQLDDAVRGEFSDLADATFDWRSPLADEGYAEYWDKAFLEHVDLTQHAADLKGFWPTGGPAATARASCSAKARATRVSSTVRAVRRSRSRCHERASRSPLAGRSSSSG
jgi:hypothetical protein